MEMVNYHIRTLTMTLDIDRGTSSAFVQAQLEHTEKILAKHATIEVSDTKAIAITTNTQLIISAGTTINELIVLLKSIPEVFLPNDMTIFFTISTNLHINANELIRVINDPKPNTDDNNDQ